MGSLTRTEQDESTMLLPSIIDRRAQEQPDKPFCALVRTANVQDGVDMITYSNYANAINKCAWWISEKLGQGVDFKTLGYMGPPDIRYSIVTLAAAKTGHKALLLSPRNSIDGQLNLLHATTCDTILKAQDFPLIDPILDALSAKRNLKFLAVAEAASWIGQGKVEVYPYNATLENEKDFQRPFVILHTSGSTSLPSPVFYTFGALTTLLTWLDPSKIVPGAEPCIADKWKNKFHYLPFPTSHMVGLLTMTALNVFWDMHPLLGPPTVVPTPSLVNDILELDICDAAILPPSIFEATAKVPEYLEGFRKLDHLNWCGAAFSSPEIANKISNVVDIFPGYGATEMGPVPVELLSQEDHEYMRISPIFGAQFKHQYDDLYELVILRDPKLKASQMVFYNFPELDEWPTKDLLSKHPTKPNMWRYRGRRDDIIVLLNGTNVNPLIQEGIIMSHPKISAALLTGTGRLEIAALIEAYDPPQNSDQKSALLDELWPTIEKSNLASNNGKITRDKIVFTTIEKPMLRAGKGSVQRNHTVAAFLAELDALYH